MSIDKTEQEIIGEFELFGEDWEGKYEHLIEMGKSLDKFPDELKTEQHLIKGCQSRVWLHTVIKNGNIFYFADSDAILTKGMIALLVRVLNGHSPEEIAASDLHFLDNIGLKEHLSPTRANGLLSMIRQMKLDAIALGLKEKNNPF